MPSTSKYLGVSRRSRLLTRRWRLTRRWVRVRIIEPSSVWGDIRSIGETECIHSLGAEIFRRRGWNLKVSPNTVAFLSKSLSPVKQNYEIHNKEMLAIIRALEEWRHFLEGAKHQFEIWMDHKNLEYFMMAKKLNRRQARWSLLLARFNFLLHHRPGKTMGKSSTCWVRDLTMGWVQRITSTWNYSPQDCSQYGL